MTRPAAPGLRIRKWDAGRWSEAPDAVVTEEPLQLLLDGEPLSVVMRTPGQDIELALGLLHAEGIARSLDAIRKIRISAESDEADPAVVVEASIVDSNQVDIHLAQAPRRKPGRTARCWRARHVVSAGRFLSKTCAETWRRCRPVRACRPRCFHSWWRGCAPARGFSTAQADFTRPACSPRTANRSAPGRT